MNDVLLYYWHWFIVALVVFTLLGYAGLMMGRGQERSVRNPAKRKERQKWLGK